MKPHYAVLLIVLFFLPSLACRVTTRESTEGSGRLITETVDVDNFNRVTLNGSGKVYIEQGTDESLVIEADDNIHPLLDTKVIGSQLVLDVKPFQDIQPSQPITYRLTVRDLNSLSLKGSGDFFVDELETKDLKISIPGSGNVMVKNFVGKDLILVLRGSGNIQFDKVDVKNIDASILGSGNITLEKGQAKNQEIFIFGSGNYLAGGLETVLSEIKIPGSGDLTVWATKDLRTLVIGEGTIQYYGKPYVEQSRLGSGKLISLGEK